MYVSFNRALVFFSDIDSFIRKQHGTKLSNFFGAFISGVHINLNTAHRSTKIYRSQSYITWGAVLKRRPPHQKKKNQLNFTPD